ncbi:MAG: DEAD/DEAH box helicase [Nanoarchaeota archaeon]
MNFKELQISEDILKAIVEAGFKEPSEIQEKAIPIIKQEKDVIAESATGSGKTLAFAVQIIEKAVKTGKVQSMVLVPTRELCEQVAKEIKKFSKHKKLNIACIYGGIAYGPQIQALEHSEIVVGTPGRVLDLIEKGNLKTNNISILVIDETDRLLDMGFLPDVSAIIEEIPKERQTLLFSATIDADVEAIGRKYMKHPEFVQAKSEVSPELLEQEFYDLGMESKFSLLVHMLKHDTSELVMVFCNTRHQVDSLTRNLLKQGVKAAAIHGGLTQSRRNKTIDEFKGQDIHVLVASDVAARGLDIPHVSHVYNYDTPKTATEYIHRIGRTARAGKEGRAVTLIASRDYENFSRIVRDERLKINRRELPNFNKVAFLSQEYGDRRRGGGGFSRGQGRRFSGGSGSFSKGMRSGGDREGYQRRSSSGFSRGRSFSRDERSEGGRRQRFSGHSRQRRF